MGISGGSMTPLKAKAKVKDRHRLVAAHFRKWKRENPKATLEEQVKMFDFLSDTAKLNEMSQ